MSEIFLPKSIKIWQLVFKLQPKMSGMVLGHSVQVLLHYCNSCDFVNYYLRQTHE